MGKIFLIVFLVFNFCNNGTSPSNSSRNHPYKEVIKLYGKQLVLKAGLTQIATYNDSFNGTNHEYFDVSLIDSIISDTLNIDRNLKDIFFNKDVELNEVTAWCESYIIAQSVFSHDFGCDVYFEDVMFALPITKHLLYKYLFEYQISSSLSVSQSYMLFYDFITFLSKIGIEQKVDILKESIEILECK